VAAVRELTKTELVRETLRLALEAIAKENPQWLQTHVPADWLHTYGAWIQGERLVRESGPRAGAEIKRLLAQTGQDGFALLRALEAPEATALRLLPAVGVLRTVWSQQYQDYQCNSLKTSLTPLDTTEDVPAAQAVHQTVHE
jgi:hypothetical protein